MFAWRKYNESKWLGFTAVFMVALMLFTCFIYFMPNIESYTAQLLLVFQLYLCVVILFFSYALSVFWNKFESGLMEGDAEMNLIHEQVGQVMAQVRNLSEEAIVELHKQLRRDKAYIETVLPNYSTVDLSLDELKAPAFRHSIHSIRNSLSQKQELIELAEQLAKDSERVVEGDFQKEQSSASPPGHQTSMTKEMAAIDEELSEGEPYQLADNAYTPGTYNSPQSMPVVPPYAGEITPREHGDVLDETALERLSEKAMNEKDGDLKRGPWSFSGETSELTE